MDSVFCPSFQSRLYIETYRSDRSRNNSRDFRQWRGVQIPHLSLFTLTIHWTVIEYNKGLNLISRLRFRPARLADQWFPLLYLRSPFVFIFKRNLNYLQRSSVNQSRMLRLERTGSSDFVTSNTYRKDSFDTVLIKSWYRYRTIIGSKESIPQVFGVGYLLFEKRCILGMFYDCFLIFTLPINASNFRLNF